MSNDSTIAAGAAEAAPAPAPKTSDILRALLTEAPGERVAVADLVAGLRNRVVGFILLLFSLPCLVPLPPGVPLVCGALMLTCGAHLALGRDKLWLPVFIARRTLGRTFVETLVARAVPLTRRLERLCRPRWRFATGRFGRAILGLIVVVLAVILMLPIPVLGNLPPGFAAAVIALGLLERDGLVIALGVLAAIAAIAVTSAMAWAAILGLGAVF